MRNNNGFNVRAKTENSGKRISKEIPRKQVILGKKKEYIWIPQIFDFNEIGNGKKLGLKRADNIGDKILEKFDEMRIPINSHS